MKHSPADVFEELDITDISTMDFNKYKYVYERALEYTPGFKEKLIKLM